MRILKTLLVLLAVLATVFLGVGLALPDRARVERSVLIDASPATVYTVLNGFRQFNRWSPWADIDPQTVYTYSGPPTGVGARQRWTSQNPAAAPAVRKYSRRRRMRRSRFGCSSTAWTSTIC